MSHETATSVDAYEYLGPINGLHPVVTEGLTKDTTDTELEQIEETLLADPEPCPFDPSTLGAALATWRDDLRLLAELGLA